MSRSTPTKHDGCAVFFAVAELLVFVHYESSLHIMFNLISATVSRVLAWFWDWGATKVGVSWPPGPMLPRSRVNLVFQSAVWDISHGRQLQPLAAASLLSFGIWQSARDT